MKSLSNNTKLETFKNELKELQNKEVELRKNLESALSNINAGEATDADIAVANATMMDVYNTFMSVGESTLLETKLGKVIKKEEVTKTKKVTKKAVKRLPVVKGCATPKAKKVAKVSGAKLLKEFKNKVLVNRLNKKLSLNNEKLAATIFGLLQQLNNMTKGKSYRGLYSIEKRMHTLIQTIYKLKSIFTYGPIAEAIKDGNAKRRLVSEYKSLNFKENSLVEVDLQLLASREVDLDKESQVYASGSEATSINNINKEGSLMKMNLQLLSRKMTDKTEKPFMESLAKLANMNFLNTNNPEVIATMVNKVINQPTGLSPMVTIATKKQKVKAEDRKNLVVENAKTSVSLGLIMRGRNRFNRKISDFSRILTKYTIGGTTMTYTIDQHLIDEFIVLKADSNSIKLYADRVFYVDFEKEGGIFAVRTEDGLVNLLNNEKIEESKAEKLNQYAFLGASASSLREKFGFFGGVLAKIKDAKTGATRSIKDLINDNCDGLMDHAKEKYTEIEAAKFSTRHMQYDTSSISMGNLGKVAKLNGKFDTALMYVQKEFENKYKGKFLYESGGTFDGLVYMPASFVAEMFKCTIDVARKISLQARPGSLKVQVQVIDDEAFYELIEFHENLGNITTHGDGDKISMIFDMNAQKANIDLSNLELEVLKVITKKPSKPSKGMLEKVIAAALEDDVNNGIDITDANSCYNKVMNRIKLLNLKGVITDTTDVLAGKSLSVSDLTNTSAICNKGVNVVPAAISGEVKNTAKSMQNSINKLCYGEGIVDYLTITTDMGMLFGMKLLKEGEIYIPSKSSKKAVDQIKRIVAIKYPTMGMKEYYSANLISFAEMKERINNAKMPELIKIAFGNKADEKFNKIKRSILKTYRTMSDALVVLPSSMDVFNSCAGLDVDTDAMAILYDKVFVDVLFGKEEFIELGSLKSDKKKKNNAISKDDQELINTIESDVFASSRYNETQKEALDVRSKNKYLLTSDLMFFAKAYVNATRGNTESIGSISNSNSRVIALYTQVLRGDMTGFNNFFKENFGTQKKDAKGKYVGLERFANKRPDGRLIYFVDEDVIDAIIEEARNMDITNTLNALTLLKDVNRIFRFYQEKTIDMAKTGGTIYVRFSCKSVIVTSLVDCEVVDIDNVKGGTFNFTISKETPELKDVKVRILNDRKEVVEEFELKQVIVNDPMGDVQDLLINVANDKMEGLISEFKILSFQQLPTAKAKNKNARLVTETIKDKDGNDVTVEYFDMSNAIEEVFTKAANKDGYNINGLYLFKKLYVELSKQFSMDVKPLDSKDDEALIEAYRNHFKAKLAWISNSCERILRDAFNTGRPQEDYVRRGMLMLAVAAKVEPHSTLNPNVTNKFALNVCDHYTKCYALNSNRVIAECKIVECDESLVGQEVELVNGVSADMKLVVKDKFKSNKVTVKVVKDQDGIKALYTEKIVAPEYNADVASMVFGTEVVEVINSNGDKVLDAGGNVKMTAKDDTLAKLINGEFATMKLSNDGTSLLLVDEDGVETVTSTEAGIFSDVKPGVVYNIGSAFLTGEGEDGLVAVELTK